MPKLMSCFENCGGTRAFEHLFHIALNVKRLKIEPSLVSWQYIASLSDSSIASFTGSTPGKLVMSESEKYCIRSRPKGLGLSKDPKAKGSL